MIYLKFVLPTSIKLLLMSSTEIGVFKQPQTIVKAVVACLKQLIEESPPDHQSTSPFNLKTPPTISMADYVARMVKYMNASPSVYVYSLLLLDRAQEYNPNFTIHKKNIHRLLLVSNLLAAKYLDDLYYKNSFYAMVGGVSLKVLNELEAEFLSLINFNCHFERATYDSYLQKLELFAEINERQETQKQNQQTQGRPNLCQEGRKNSTQKVQTIASYSQCGQPQTASQ